ncbi:nucleoside hydrolase [Microbacterium sp.]|uniref:nucleoside hydrolase n=1 Tax=Microbacterium sp. TaxID=51671 RepID=UPI003C75AE85
MSIPIYFDTDLGIDDAMALAYLLTSPEAEIVGIGSVHGNVDAERAARNVLDFLSLAGRTDIEVAVGARDPLASPFDGGAPMVHGENGIGEVDLPSSPRAVADESAAEMLVRLAREYEGRLRVVAIGPFTNLALALAIDPGIAARVDGVYVMGGAAMAPGNMSPVAEANIMHDPEAADAVFQAAWNVVVAPLDVTMEHRLTMEHRDLLAASSWAPNRAIAGMLDVYVRWYAPIFGQPVVALHDPIAAALAIEAIDVASAPRVQVTVDATYGPGRGQTICDMRGRFLGYPSQESGAVVVLELAEPFAPHLMERLLGGAKGAAEEYASDAA